MSPKHEPPNETWEQRIERKLDTLNLAVAGDEEMGHRGLVQRMDSSDKLHMETDRRMTRLETRMAVYVGVCVGAMAVIKFLFK